MAVRKLNPVTPGQRHKVAITFDQLTTDRPEKSLLGPKSKTGGRNNTGKMTMRYIGGGHKRKYRVIDFKREKENIPAKVATIEYDPNRENCSISVCRRRKTLHRGTGWFASWSNRDEWCRCCSGSWKCIVLI